MADEKKKRYYRIVETIICLRYPKKDGTMAKVTKGQTLSGRVVTVIPAGDAHRIIVEEMREGTPWPGQSRDGTWPPLPSTPGSL